MEKTNLDLLCDVFLVDGIGLFINVVGKYLELGKVDPKCF